MNRPPGESKILLLFLALVVLSSVFHYVHDLAKLQMESQFIDFAHYYTYAKVVALGLNPFDAQAVAQVDAALNIRRAGAAPNYPPLFYLFMQPLVVLPFSGAVVVWGIVVQACLFATLALCFRRFQAVSTLWGVAVVFVVLNYQPLVEDLALGQTNVVLLFLVTLAWWGLRSRHPWVSACAVAMAMHIKAQYGLLLPLLWWMGHGRVALRACMMAMLGLLVGLAVLGLEQHLAYVRYILHLPEYLHAWVLNLSYRATLIRLLGGPGDVVALLLSAVLLIVFARAIPRAGRPDSDALDMAWGLGLVAIPLLSPLTEEHHLVVLLFPLILLLLGEPASSMDRKTQVLLVGSIVLLGSRYSLVQFPTFHQGGLSLFGIGKLLGIVGLAWVLAVRLAARADPAGCNRFAQIR